MCVSFVTIHYLIVCHNDEHPGTSFILECVHGGECVCVCCDLLHSGICMTLTHVRMVCYIDKSTYIGICVYSDCAHSDECLF